MSGLNGSSWAIWDLHVHTPESHTSNYSGPDVWDLFLKDLENLPPEFKAIGINDYIFLNGYKRVLAEKKKGRLSNIDLILPVIELRVNRFGGVDGDLSKVNFHVVFSDQLSPEVIESQFLNGFFHSYQLSTGNTTDFSGIVTETSISDFGKKIRESSAVPLTGASDFELGFNNLHFDLKEVRKLLSDSDYLRNHHVTAVGKTEWADIRWTQALIAEKKDIINKAHFIFSASPDALALKRSVSTLRSHGVNDRLLDCSDAHHNLSSTQKDRIGNCRTWVKGDRSFEGLRQAWFEYESRVHLGDAAPLDPIHGLRNTVFSFPENTRLGEYPFCCRGNVELHFSPNFTCVIGGRGVGKSTALKLIAHKLGVVEATSDELLSKLKTESNSINEYVRVNEDEQVLCAFVGQEMVEKYASEPKMLTTLIESLLHNYDPNGNLQDSRQALKNWLEESKKQSKTIEEYWSVKTTTSQKQETIKRLAKLVEVVEDADYQKLRSKAEESAKAIASMEASKLSIQAIVQAVEQITPSSEKDALPNGTSLYEVALRTVVSDVRKAVEGVSEEAFLISAEQELSEARNKQITFDSDIEEHLKAKGYSQDSVSDISNAITELSALREEMRMLSERESLLSDTIEAFDRIPHVTKQYEDGIADALSVITGELSELDVEVKAISLEYVFQKDSMLSSIATDLVRATNSRTDHTIEVLTQLPLDGDFRQEDILEKLDTLKTTKTATAVKLFLKDQKNFDLFKHAVMHERANAFAHGLFVTRYDGRLLHDCSFGQRCTAVLVLILSLGNTPVIVDEPEAHLDSGLIARYLVKLIKSKKQSRQIVFATHNANFVINGDAEQIIELKQDQDGRTTFTPFTIESLEKREVLMSLEGGKEAFERRERRYN
jgi:exonuclease SbcC